VGSKTTLSSNYFDSNKFCWYRFYPSYKTINEIEIEIKSLVNAKAEVYLEESTNSFIYKASLGNGDSKTISLNGYYDPVWVLVTPTASNAYISVQGKAGSSSSYDSSLSSSALSMIIIFSIVGFVMLIALIGLSIFCRYKRRQREMSAFALNSNAIAVSQQQPSPYNPYYGNQNQAMANQTAMQINQGVPQGVQMMTPMPNYPAQNYPMQNYSAQNYPVQNYPAQNVQYMPAQPMMIQPGVPAQGADGKQFSVQA